MFSEKQRTDKRQWERQQGNIFRRNIFTQPGSFSVDARTIHRVKYMDQIATFLRIAVEVRKCEDSSSRDSSY